MAIILFSGMSCLAPVLYASDCSRWVAEYKQGILQRRAARRLRAAKYRLVAMVHKPQTPHPHPMRHRMGPLEALRRFQIDCGDIDQPTPSPLLPVLNAELPHLPLDPTPLDVQFPETPPVDLPVPTLTEIAEAPPIGGTPGAPIYAGSVPPLGGESFLPPLQAPSVPAVPEPASFALVLTGAAVGLQSLRKRSVAS